MPALATCLLYACAPRPRRPFRRTLPLHGPGRCWSFGLLRIGSDGHRPLTRLIEPQLVRPGHAPRSLIAGYDPSAQGRSRATRLILKGPLMVSVRQGSQACCAAHLMSCVYVASTRVRARHTLDTPFHIDTHLLFRHTIATCCLGRNCAEAHRVLLLIKLAPRPHVAEDSGLPTWTLACGTDAKPVGLRRCMAVDTDGLRRL